MDYSFCRPDLEKEAKCESCDVRDADHVLVLVYEKVTVGMVGIFQICYECSVMVDFGGKDYRFIPKKNAKRRNENSTPLCNPGK